MDIPINNDDKCTICLENLNDTVNTKLNCNHIFCINCIKKLINNHDSNKEIKCPLCRIDINWVMFCLEFYPKDSTIDLFIFNQASFYFNICCIFN